MPVFGKSLFETVLDGLDGPVVEEEEEAPAHIRGFNASFVGREWSARPEGDIDPSLMFADFAPDPLPPEEIEAEIPAWLERLSEDEIAADLLLSACRNEHDLRERRRVFALANHPDRVSADYRDQATRRMMIANQLIDTALARLK